jgi:hypothetical protein
MRQSDDQEADMPRKEAADIEGQVAAEIDALETPAPSEAKQATPAKPAEQAPPAPAQDDPDVELEGGRKVKMSELKKGYMMQSDYTIKTQELAEQRKEVEELQQLANFLRANPEKLKRVIAVLDEKQEQIAEQKQENLQELQGLDPNDPFAKTLIAQNKMLSDLQKQIAGMKETQDNSHKETLVAQAQQVLSKTLDDTAKTLTFENDDEKSLWRQMVLSYLKDNPRQYIDEADFVKTIGEIGKRYFDSISKIAENRVAKYVKSKSGAVPAVPSTPGAPMKRKPTTNDLEDILKEELEKADAENKEK